MKTTTIIALSVIILFSSCNSKNSQDLVSHFFENMSNENQWINSEGNTIEKRVNTPQGFQ